MSRLKQHYKIEGFYGIGILNSESESNTGTLWRSAFVLGAAFIFTINRKYDKQSSDVTRAWTKIPLVYHETFEAFQKALPRATKLVGVEMCDSAIPLAEFKHPQRAVYLLGSESMGLPDRILDACHTIISLPGHFSLNVSVAGSIVMYDRLQQHRACLPE